jgi:hypothetical protein
VTTPTPRFEIFSVEHAQILDGATTFLAAATAPLAPDNLDIYGVRESTLSPNTDDYENTGDDVSLSYWQWLNFADLSVTSGYLSLPLLSEMSGRPISSQGSGAGKVFGYDLWHEDDVNVAPRPMIVRCPSRDEDGNPRTATIGLYKVQFGVLSFDGLAYKSGATFTYAARALKSRKDELGVAFADGKRRVGKLISHA